VNLIAVIKTYVYEMCIMTKTVSVYGSQCLKDLGCCSEVLNREMTKFYDDNDELFFEVILPAVLYGCET
jgi:hypothetical protein